MSNESTGTDTLTEDMQSTLALLKESAGNDEIPASVSGVDAGDDKHKGAASHAFAEKNKQLKTALLLIDKQSGVIKDLQNPDTSTPGLKPEQPPAGAGTPEAQAAIVQRVLTQQALTNLGLTDVNQSPQMVQLEVNRLYSNQAAELERRRDAQGTAPAFVDSALATFGQLTDEDRVELKQRLGKMDVLDQTNEQMVHKQVALYVGEQALAGRVLTGEGGGENAGEATGPVGDLKNTGSMGVKPGESTTKGKKTPVPATTDELAQMKALRMTDLKAFRAAKLKQSNYAGR